MNDSVVVENKDGAVPLLPFYVYVLIDPVNGKVFYVGKGQGTRVQHHVTMARSPSKQEDALDDPKMEKIQEILATGCEPTELVVARFETESEAFAVEATLIQWVYGFANLTNLIQGRGADCIRVQGNLGECQRLDVPEPVRRNDGDFSDNNRRMLNESGAVDLLTKLKKLLQDEKFEIRDFSEKSDRPFDPGMANGWLGLIVRIGAVDFLLNFSKTCKVSIYVANTEFSRTEKARCQLQKIEQEMGQKYLCGSPINIKINGQGRYRPFAVRPRFDGNNLNSLVATLQKFSNLK